MPVNGEYPAHSYNDGALRYFTAVLVAFHLLLSGAGSGDAAPGIGQTGAARELRGVWVTRASIASPAAVDTLVTHAAAAGINALFVQVRGRGDAYFQSDLEPRGAMIARQPAAFDPLARVIERAHARGIAVHAWVNVNLVSDTGSLPASRDHIIRRHPEWLMVPRALAARASATDARSPAYLDALVQWTRANITKVEGLYASPIPRDARAHAVAIARDLARRYALDGLHLDYVRFPNDSFDYSPGALAEFRASLAGELPAAELAQLDTRAADTPTIATDRFPDRWLAFRRARVTWLVDGMSAAAREERPGILISVAVVPDPNAALTIKLQDWPSWAARGLVDAICPMAYAEDRAGYTAQLAAVHEAAGGVAVWTGIGAYRLTAAETAYRIRQARTAGSAGVLLFSYDSVSSGRRGSRYLLDVARAAFPAGTREPSTVSRP